MRACLPALAALAVTLSTAAAAVAPPREESPASPEILAGFGTGNSDAEIAQEIAAAAAHPLGTLANPVRAAGPEGARAYLARLRCADGTAPRIGVRSDGAVGAFGSVTAVYPLDCAAAAPGKVDLVVDIYQVEHAETGAPPGFAITPR